MTDQNEESDRSGGSIPKLTNSYLESLIASEQYTYFEEAGTTVCCLQLKSTYSITVSVVCANPALRSEARGRERARRKAMAELLDKEYYTLRSKLYDKQLGIGERGDE